MIAFGVNLGMVFYGIIVCITKILNDVESFYMIFTYLCFNLQDYSNCYDYEKIIQRCFINLPSHSDGGL